MNGEFLRGLLTALVGAGLMLVLSGCTVDDGEADCACGPMQTAVEGKCYANKDVTTEEGGDPTVTEGAQSFECQAAAAGGNSDGDNPAGGDDAPAGGDDAPAGGDDEPVGGDDAPVGGDDAPVGGDDAPAGGDDTPAGGDEAPAGGMSGGGPDLSGIGQACGNENAGFGFCADNTGMTCEGQFADGLCPGAAQVQCCLSHACTTDEGDEGVCLGESTCSEYEGTATPGLCPGSASVKCCTGLDEDTMMMMSGGGDDNGSGGAEAPAGGSDG